MDCLDIDSIMNIYRLPSVEINTVVLSKHWFEVGQSIPTLVNGRKVVMKKCTDDDKNMQKRFVESYLRLRSCNHKNIVTAFFASEIDGHWMFVMEHGEQSLDNLLRQTEAFPTERGRNAAGGYTMSHCISWTRQIADALSYLHDDKNKKKIIHRDVKCANILLFDKSTLCKLSDFDDCRYLSNEMTPLIGTPNHMAPEVANLRKTPNERQMYTEKCDCYSLGVTILEMIFRMSTGSIPKIVAEDGANAVKWYYSADGPESYSVSLESAVFDYKTYRNEFDIIKSILDNVLLANPEERLEVTAVLEKLKQLQYGEPPALELQDKSGKGVGDASPDRSTNQEQPSVSNKSCCVFYTVSFTDALQYNFDSNLSGEMEKVLNAMGNRANTMAAKDTNQPFVAEHKFQIMGERNSNVLKIQHTIGGRDATDVAKYCEENSGYTAWLAEQFKGDNHVPLRSLQFAIWRSSNLDNDDVSIMVSDLGNLSIPA